MKVIFDGKEVVGNESASNLVEFLENEGITIFAPCYRENKDKKECSCGCGSHSKTCCKSCILLVNGEEKYACSTKPFEGMEIVYSREDLNLRRLENLKKYQDSKLLEIDSSCDCGDTCTCNK